MSRFTRISGKSKEKIYLEMNQWREKKMLQLVRPKRTRKDGKTDAIREVTRQVEM